MTQNSSNWLKMAQIAQNCLKMAKKWFNMAQYSSRLLKMAKICLKSGKWFKNCLLYTSPSPRDAHESRMPSSA